MFLDHRHSQFEHTSKQVNAVSNGSAKSPLKTITNAEVDEDSPDEDERWAYAALQQPGSQHKSVALILLSPLLKLM